MFFDDTKQAYTHINLHTDIQTDKRFVLIYFWDLYLQKGVNMWRTGR